MLWEATPGRRGGRRCGRAKRRDGRRHPPRRRAGRDRRRTGRIAGGGRSRAEPRLHPDNQLTYTVLRLGQQQMLNVEAGARARRQPRRCTSFCAAIGIFTLLVGASVRLRRPHDPATLHFFWLCLAFFGTLTFSFSRLDRLDWYFYWADVVATLLLAPLFLHFTLVFPDRPASWVRGDRQAASSPLLYVPAGAAVPRQRHRRRAAAAEHRRCIRACSTTLDQVEPLYLSVLHDRRPRRADARDGSRAFGHRAPPASLDRVGHRVRRRAVCHRATRCPTRSGCGRRCRWSCR